MASRMLMALKADVANCLVYILDGLDGSEAEIKLKFRVICNNLLANALDADLTCDAVLEKWFADDQGSL